MVIRGLIGAAVPLVGLAVSLAFIGPDLIVGPRGAPMVEAAPGAPALSRTAFRGEACALKLAYRDDAAGMGSGILENTRVIAYALRPDGEDVEMAIKDFPGHLRIPRRTLVMLFDETGKLVAVSKEPTLAAAAAIGRRGDCLAGSAKHQNPI